jgi:mannose-1-phosphate guanylyltransferase
MYSSIAYEHRWGVILAGGEGARLRSLTRFVSGDERPKQFCPLLGDRTLLTQTRQRIARRVPAERTLFVVLRSHERFWANQLKEAPPTRMVVQPSNRGTLPAILCSLLRIGQLDSEAVVAFFPSDHHYAEEERFLAGLDLAYGAAEADPLSVILLGAAAKHAEVEYGWIEAEAVVSDEAPQGILRVKRFWEKPSPQVARDLLVRGCIWNTFVMVGRARAFLEIIRSSVPGLFQAFESVPEREMSAETLEPIYAKLSAADFSQLVLSGIPRRIGVLSLGDVGWSDLGDPRRVITMLHENGVQNEWLTLWKHGHPATISNAC